MDLRILALALVALLGVSAHATPNPATTWEPADVAVSPATGPGARPSSEISVAIDPTNPSRMVAAAIEHGHEPGFVCCSRGIWKTATFHTTDGGATWTRTGTVVPMGSNGQPMDCDDPTTWDPWVVFDRHGRVYVSYVSSGAGLPHVPRPCTDDALAVATSTDGGETWGNPVVIASPPACFPDRAGLAAAPGSDAVYVTWITLGCTPRAIYASRSTDGGATWSAPVAVTTPTDQKPYGPSPRVGPDGSLYVAYYRAAPFDGCVFFTGRTLTSVVSAEAVVAFSRDGGVTWARQVVGPVCDAQFQSVGQPLNGGGDFSWPMLAADPVSGRLAIAWVHREGADPVIRVSTSGTGGSSWSSPSSVGELGRGGFMPAVALGGDVVRLAYVSMGTAGDYDVIYRESPDGSSWSEPFRLNTAFLCNCWGPLTSTYVHGLGLGHYIGLDASAGKVVAVWPDARDPTGYQTPYARVASYG